MFTENLRYISLMHQATQKLGKENKDSLLFQELIQFKTTNHINKDISYLVNDILPLDKYNITSIANIHRFSRGGQNDPEENIEQGNIMIISQRNIRKFISISNANGCHIKNPIINKRWNYFTFIKVNSNYGIIKATDSKDLQMIINNAIESIYNEVSQPIQVSLQSVLK